MQTMLHSLNNGHCALTWLHGWDRMGVPAKNCVLGFRRAAEAGGRWAAAEWVHVCP